MSSKCCEDTQCLLIIISFQIGALVFVILSTASSNWYIAKFGQEMTVRQIGVFKTCSEEDCAPFTNNIRKNFYIFIF